MREIKETKDLEIFFFKNYDDSNFRSEWGNYFACNIYSSGKNK
jgi:hypothetical protein